MDPSTLTDIAQLSEIYKSKGFLFLLEIFVQKQTCSVCLYIMSIQPQHYTTWQGCSARGWLSQITFSNKTQLQGHFHS